MCHLGLTHLLQSQHLVSLPAKAPGTVTYKALETIYTVLVMALSVPEALTGSSEFGSCVCEQMAPGLRWGILWEELQVKKHSPDTD